MTIATQHHFPICCANAVHVVCPRRTTLGVIVLRAAVNVVKRLTVVEGELVILRHRQVFHVSPGRAEVEALIHPAIRPHHDVIGVGGVENDGVHVAVLIGVLHGRKGLAAILGFLNGRPHQIETIKLVWAGEDLLIVVRPGATSHRIGALDPACSAVGRAPHATLPALQLYGCINHVWILRRDRQSNFAHVALRQSGFQLSPTQAAVY